MSKQQVSQEPQRTEPSRPMISSGQEDELSLKEKSRRNRKHKDETHAYVRAYN